MSGSIAKEDLVDLDFIDAPELASIGSASDAYKSSVSVTSTTAATKRVVISGFNLATERDTPTEAGDLVVLAGTTGGADGTYTFDAVINANTFTVVEAIVDSTGGTAEFRHPPGASKVGVDPAAIAASSATTLQGVLEDIDGAISSGGITESQHKALRDLIHFVDGPADGWATGLYFEQLPSGDPFPTSGIWYESSGKTKKIVEQTVAYNANRTINTDTHKIYDTDGSTVLVTLVDTYAYTGVFIDTVTRTWS